MEDLYLDLRQNELKGQKKEYYKFIGNNPKAMSQFLPFGKYDGKWVVDPTMCLVWIVSIFFGTLILIKIISKFI